MVSVANKLPFAWDMFGHILVSVRFYLYKSRE